MRILLHYIIQAKWILHSYLLP